MSYEFISKKLQNSYSPKNCYQRVSASYNFLNALVAVNTGLHLLFVIEKFIGVDLYIRFLAGFIALCVLVMSAALFTSKTFLDNISMLKSLVVGVILLTLLFSSLP